MFSFLNVMRYGFPAALFSAAVIVLIPETNGERIGGFVMLVAGALLSFLVLDGLYHLSDSSEVERDEEDEARTYLSSHGEWPDEAPERRG